MPSRANAGPELLNPARLPLILASLLVGLTLNLLPWQGLALLVKPDFVILPLLYWSVHQPRKIGIGMAWLAGLVMDVAYGSLFGQHALAYAIAAYGALALRRRILMFSVWRQALHVLPLMLLAQSVVVITRLAAGFAFIGWTYFFGSVAGALLWPLLSYLLLLPRRSAAKGEVA